MLSLIRHLRPKHTRENLSVHLRRYFAEESKKYEVDTTKHLFPHKEYELPKPETSRPMMLMNHLNFPYILAPGCPLLSQHEELPFIELTSVKRKRRSKMNKHKLKRLYKRMNKKRK